MAFQWGETSVSDTNQKKLSLTTNLLMFQNPILKHVIRKFPFTLFQIQQGYYQKFNFDNEEVGGVDESIGKSIFLNQDFTYP